MTTLRFAHVGIAAKDPEITEAFYTKHFGFERARVVDLGEEQILFLKTSSGDLYLEMFKATEPPPTPPVLKDGPVSPGFRHLAFQVDSVDQKLAEMGPEARITLGPLDFDDFIPGWRAVWIQDPDGRIIEISQGYRDN
jgi:glyoxylase I family protein